MKKWKFLTAAAMLTLALAACGDEETKEADKEKEAPAAEATEAAEGTDSVFPLTVQSLTGERETEDGQVFKFDEVTFEEEPKRVISFDYGFLDTLDALGVEGIVGVAANGGQGNVPAHLKDKYAPSDSIQDVGSLKEINLEAVAAAEPDVIFISGRQSGYYEDLKEITPNVLFVGSDNPSYVEGLYESVDLAATIFGAEEKAEELKAEFQVKVDAVKEKAAGYENALVAMYNEKKIAGFDNGEESRFAYVYNDFGFTPVTTDIETSSHGSDFSFESILKVNPEVLLVIDRTVSDVETLKAEVENDIIKKTRAYEEGKIVYLDGVNWYFSSNGITTEADKLDEILNELK